MNTLVLLLDNVWGRQMITIGIQLIIMEHIYINMVSLLSIIAILFACCITLFKVNQFHLKPFLYIKYEHIYYQFYFTLKTNQH